MSDRKEMKYIGKEMPRIDGLAKVTGKATYAAEFQTPNLTYGFIVQSTIAKGTIKSIDTSAAEAAPGVIKIFTYENTPQPVRSNGWRALADNKIVFSGQPVALVVAETFEQARYASRLVKVAYDQEKPTTSTEAGVKAAQDAPNRRKMPPRGDANAAFAAAPVKIEQVYTIPIEHHNPMEPHGGIAVWDGDHLTFYDKTQGVFMVRDHLAGCFGLNNDQVDVVSHFVGGAFGSALRPNYYPWITAMAARDIKRPVKTIYTRRQMFTGNGYRPYTWQKVALAANKDGKLQAIIHEHANNTSTTDNYTEGMFGVARTVYACDNVLTDSVPVKTDLPTPCAMRAPGAVSQMFALESAMDELAYALNIDPLELRLINYSEKDPDSGKPWSSKELRKAYEVGAKKFGWEKRSMAPRSMRDGNLLVGWGTATGYWPAMQQGASIEVTLRGDGTASVKTGASDIGPGTYTMVAVIAAESLGIPVERIKVELGDSKLPRAPVQGGSFTTASVGSAMHGAAQQVAKQLLDLANKDANSPLTGASEKDVEFWDGHLRLIKEPAKSVSVSEVLQKNGIAELKESYDARPSAERNKYSTASHGAQFVEVKVDPDLGIVRVTRVVEATATGRIINPLTSHSQEIGGVVWGIGMALTEGTEVDHRYGRMMNPTLADYHVPVNADIQSIETLFIEENDPIVNELGIKGMGELGMVGIPAAVANAIFHATGKRMRDLPITPDKLI